MAHVANAHLHWLPAGDGLDFDLMEAMGLGRFNKPKAPDAPPAIPEPIKEGHQDKLAEGSQETNASQDDRACVEVTKD